VSDDGAGLTDELVVELTPAEPAPEPEPDVDLDE
jgi:hypothetical protein